MTLNRVGDGAADARHREHVLLGVQLALGDGGRDFTGLAVADTHGAVAVADHNQCGEAEGTATLVGLGHTVDGHHAIEQLVAVVFFTTVTTLATTAFTALATTTLAVLVVGFGRHSVLSFFSHLGFLRFVVAHSARPPSRAPSATAATRPVYLLPPRSNTTAVMPAALAFSAISSPTFLAASVLVPSKPAKSA